MGPFKGEFINDDAPGCGMLLVQTDRAQTNVWPLNRKEATLLKKHKPLYRKMKFHWKWHDSRTTQLCLGDGNIN